MGGYGTARNEKQKHHLFPSAPSPRSRHFLLVPPCVCPISTICHPLAFTVHFIHSFLKDNWFSPLIPLTWRQREMRGAQKLEEPHIYHPTRQHVHNTLHTWRKMPRCTNTFKFLKKEPYFQSDLLHYTVNEKAHEGQVWMLNNASHQKHSWSHFNVPIKEHAASFLTLDAWANFSFKHAMFMGVTAAMQHLLNYVNEYAWLLEICSGQAL